MKKQKDEAMTKITLTCKDPGKFFHDCKDCEHYGGCDYPDKKKRARMVIINPRQLRQMKLGLKERMKVRQRQEQKRRERYYK